MPRSLTDARPGGAPLFGLLLALTCGVSFACNSALAKIAFEEGSDPLTIITLRTTAAAVVVAIVVAIWPPKVPLTRHQRLWALALGVIVAIYSYGLLSAIEYIPVALAVIIFYTYPLIGAAILWTTGRDTVPRPTAIALVLAFTGLVLTLEVWRFYLDALGVAYAAMGAIFMGVLLVLNSRLVGSGDSRPVTMHMMPVAAALYIVVLVADGGPTLPHSTLGWLASFGVAGFYTFSIIGVFIAISMAGPVRTGLAMNIEPVSSLLLGWFVLGQVLEAVQVAGMAVVVGAIVLARLAPGRSR
ncbi:MAG: hypothetical protein FJX53_11025 [Alphaproteobacteria bacterium]|nr:hypothetical protein [Alphaproteobacteria bacterium]